MQTPPSLTVSPSTTAGYLTVGTTAPAIAGSTFTPPSTPTTSHLTSNPDDDFPFVFNCAVATPYVVLGTTAYTGDLFFDVLVLADGVTYQIKDVVEFEEEYRVGRFGRTWPESAKSDLYRLVEEIEGGRFLDNLHQIAQLPTEVRSDELGTVQLFGPDEVDFKYHSDLRRFV